MDYATYHPLQEPEKSIENIAWLGTMPSFPRFGVVLVCPNGAPYFEGEQGLVLEGSTPKIEDIHRFQGIVL